MSSPPLLDSFFGHLSDRLANENDASDVLYAAFKASDICRSGILKSLEIPEGVPVDIRREVAIGNSRPDFRLSVGDLLALVEVKLFDRNYHYEEYSGLEIDGRLPDVIILLTAHTPYIPPPSRRWRVVQWRAIIENLKESRDEFGLAIACYFGKVTMTETLETIRLERPKGIFYLNRAIKHVILQYASEDWSTRLYKQGNCFDETGSGYYYWLKHQTDAKRSAWPWFGLAYNENREGIEASLRKDWHKDTYSHLLDALQNFYDDRLKTDDGWCYVSLPEEDFKKFFSHTSSASVNEQLEILKKFFEEFNRVLQGCLAG